MSFQAASRGAPLRPPPVRRFVLMGLQQFREYVQRGGGVTVPVVLPMLPSQILFNNLLYDSSQLPTDDVDPEQLARPSRWDVGFIRRFMLFFGTVSPVSDFVAFEVILWVFHADAPLFRSGWFVESLATQALVILAIRTRRIPFFRSHPSVPLLIAALGAITVGTLLPPAPPRRPLHHRRQPSS